MNNVIMRAAILHFTDLHFKESGNYLISLTQKIFSAIRLDLFDIEQIFIVISGDIVDKGQNLGYSEARDFICDLQKLILTDRPGRKVNIVIVPGNHDCNFLYDNQLRKNSIQTVNYETIGQDNSVIDLCLSVQKDFWSFYEDFGAPPVNKLFFQMVVDDSSSICFNCINTAWMSKIREEPALFFPVKRIVNSTPVCKGKFNISVLHHPILWFSSTGESNNRKEFQDFMEEISDIILCGHEHEEDHKKSIELWTGRETLYFSGMILQPAQKSNSGFQLIKLNTLEKTGEIKVFHWHEDVYVCMKAMPLSFENLRVNNNRFKNNQDFIKSINTIKIPLLSEYKEDLSLSDIFVFPDLEKQEHNGNDFEAYYDSEKLLKEENFSTCIIEGESQSGTSSLLSMLYQKFIEKDINPLLLDCNTFKTTDVDKVLGQAYNKQYIGGEKDFERYLQEDKFKKVVLVDNLHVLSFSPKIIKGIIVDLEQRFGKVIIATNTLYGLLSKIEAEFDELVVFTLRPLGYKKRNKLIESYHRFSLESCSLNDEILLEKTKVSFGQVEAVLGDKLMPSYPIFILSILQTLVYVRPTTLEQTSYGYCYQSLIHLALFKKANVKNEYIDTYFNFLAEFSFHLYKSDIKIFTEDILKNFFNEYQQEYHIGFSYEALRRVLIESNLICIQDDDWQFTYSYIFYFLVARKIAEIINKEEGRKAVQYLCSNLHNERNANVLIFVAHHTKDDFLIQEATFTTMVPFEGMAPITLDKNDPFYNLLKDIVEQVCSDIIDATSNPLAARDEMLESQDKRALKQTREKRGMHHNEESEGFDEFMVPFFQAFRALDIVGQIIKNRKGSLPTSTLIDMIIELYHAAFRTISFFGFSLFEAKDDFIESLSSRFVDGESKHNIESKVNSFFQFTALQICLGLFTKVIHAVGQKDLRPLFIEAANKISTPAADIVTFSINSCFGNLSTGELQKIAKKYENNPVALKIIKARVKSYLYQNYVDYKKRQSFASTLKMKIAPYRR
ncbi:MAG: metallophosphoesterase [Bacteroidales bacterium]|nr:metallophosphoesterase [Bacteroidales bacterium]